MKQELKVLHNLKKWGEVNQELKVMDCTVKKQKQAVARGEGGGGGIG